MAPHNSAIIGEKLPLSAMANSLPEKTPAWDPRRYPKGKAFFMPSIRSLPAPSREGPFPGKRGPYLRPSSPFLPGEVTLWPRCRPPLSSRRSPNTPGGTLLRVPSNPGAPRWPLPLRRSTIEPDNLDQNTGEGARQTTGALQLRRESYQENPQASRAGGKTRQTYPAAP